MAENDKKKDNGQQEKPKIIVDDDWKAHAQAEKEKLAEQIEEQGQQAGAEAVGPSDPHGELPPASFTTLVSSIMTQAFLALGGLEDPQTKKRYVDLDLAKHHIDSLKVLEEKTTGNLNEDEKKLLDRAIYETRIQYVQIAQHVAGG